MNLIQAFNKKLEIIEQKVYQMDKRSNPRVPYRLGWIGNYFSIATHKYSVPSNCVSFKNVSVNVPIDKLARTFCALEDFEDWLDRVRDGSKKHQQEMEKQAETKIVRFKTFASMGFCKEERDEENVPF